MGCRVLIVDDSMTARRFLRRVLDVSGVGLDECLEAPNGDAAVEVLQDQPVDLVITDINMPGMNGAELVDWIDRHKRSLPVIVVSTDSSAARIQRLSKAGPRGYVPKPFTPETLRAEIDRVLAARAASNLFTELLETCSQTALEEMFFTSVIEAPEWVREIPGGCIRAQVRFTCELPGRLEVAVEPELATAITANFLAVEEETLTGEQIADTVCELTNVICGSLLSRLESRDGFQISPPEPIADGADRAN